MEMWKQIFSQKMQQVHPGDKWALKLDDNLQPNVLGPGWMQFLQQRAFGRFQCSQCHHAWQSAQVHVLFHIHLDRRQREGQVKMKIFRQECKKCLLVVLEEPQFSPRHVKRVLDSLGRKIRQKCYGEAAHPNSVPTIVAGDPTKGSHDSTCCGLGVCSMKHETQMLPDVIVGSTCTRPDQWEQTGVATGLQPQRPVRTGKQPCPASQGLCPGVQAEVIVKQTLPFPAQQRNQRPREAPKRVNMELWERKFTLKMALRVPGHSWSLTQEDNLNPWSLPYGWHQFQQKKCFARFQCSSCPNCWPSAQVLVTFHMHLDARERRGRVKMRPFGQKCKRCWGRKFEKPKFSEKNVERILDNVVLTIQEKLYRQPVANRHLLEPLVEDYVEGPHDTARCEACALGICYLRDLAPQSQPSAPPYHFVATASRAVTSPSGPQAQWVADTRDGTEAMNYAVVIVIVLLMLAALYFRN